ncbi:MAG: helix-turn-helix domain-containing protein [Burkholderiales bacterium]
MKHLQDAGNRNIVESELLTRPQAAAFLGVSERTLAIWACVKRYGLPYIRVGRLVRYRRSDLEAFLAARTVKAAPPEA